MKEKFLSEKQRAEDILLGSLGFGQDASIVACLSDENYFWGEGVYSDGEKFTFKSEDPITDLERWAIQVLSQKRDK